MSVTACFDSSDEFHTFVKQFYEAYDPERGSTEAFEFFSRLNDAISAGRTHREEGAKAGVADSVQQTLLNELFALYPEALANTITMALCRYAPYLLGQGVETQLMDRCDNFTGVATWLMQKFDLLFGYFLPRDTALRVAVLCREEWMAYFGEPSSNFVRPGVTGEQDLLLRLSDAGGAILDERTTIRRFTERCEADASIAQRDRAVLWRQVWRSSASRAISVDAMMTAAGGDVATALQRYADERSSRCQRTLLELHFSRLGLGGKDAANAARNALLSRPSQSTDVLTAVHVPTTSQPSVVNRSRSGSSGVAPAPGSAVASPAMMVNAMPHMSSIAMSPAQTSRWIPPAPSTDASPVRTANTAPSNILSPSTPFASSLQGILGGGGGGGGGGGAAPNDSIHRSQQQRFGTSTTAGAGGAIVSSPDGMELVDASSPIRGGNSSFSALEGAPSPIQPSASSFAALASPVAAPQQRLNTFSCLDVPIRPVASFSVLDFGTQGARAAAPPAEPNAAEPQAMSGRRPSPGRKGVSFSQAAPPHAAKRVDDGNRSSSDDDEKEPLRPLTSAPALSSVRWVVSETFDDPPSDPLAQTSAPTLSTPSTAAAIANVDGRNVSHAEIIQRLRHVEAREQQLKAASAAARQQLEQDAAEAAELRAVLERSANAIASREEAVSRREAAFAAREAAIEKQLKQLQERETIVTAASAKAPEEAQRLRRVHQELQARERELEEFEAECAAAVEAVNDREARLAQAEAAGEARIARRLQALEDEAAQLREQFQKRQDALNQDIISLREERGEWMQEQSVMLAAREEHAKKLKESDDAVRRRERAVAIREEEVANTLQDIERRERQIAADKEAIRAAREEMSARATAVKQTAESLEQQAAALDQQALRLKQREEALWRVSALAGAAVQRSQATSNSSAEVDDSTNVMMLASIERSLGSSRNRLQRLGTSINLRRTPTEPAGH